MAALALGVVGAGIGSSIGGTILGISATAIGMSIGSTAGQFIDSMLQPSAMTYGSRLDDTRIQSGSYDTPVPIVYGRFRVAGAVVDGGTLREVAVSVKNPGGKGGLFGGGSRTTYYTYYWTGAVMVADCLTAPIVAVEEIWGDSKVVYTNGGQTVVDPTNLMNDLANPHHQFDADAIRIYLGSTTQEADPALQAAKGVEETPAYRRYAYVVFESLNLTRNFANHVPNFNFLVHGLSNASGGSITGFVQNTAYAQDAYAEAVKPIPLDSDRVLYPSRDGLKIVSSTNGVPTVTLLNNGVPGPIDSILNMAVSADSTKAFVFFKTVYASNFLTDTTGQNVPYVDTYVAVVDLVSGQWGVARPPSVFSTGRLNCQLVWVGDNCVLASDAVSHLPLQNTTIISFHITGTTIINETNYGVSNPVGTSSTIYSCRILQTSASEATLVSYDGDYKLWACSLFANNASSPTAFVEATRFVEPPSWIISDQQYGPSNTYWMRMHVQDSTAQHQLFRFTIGGGTGTRTVGPFPAEATGLDTGDAYFERCVTSDGSSFFYWNANSSPTAYHTMSIDGSSGWVSTPIAVNPTGGFTTGDCQFINSLGTGDALITTSRYEVEWFIYGGKVSVPTDVTVDIIVGDLCLRAGYTPDQLDLTRVRDVVHGYAVSTKMTAASAIDPLMAAYDFLIQRVGNQLRTVYRQADPVGTIRVADMGAYIHTDTRPSPLTTARKGNIQLAQEMEITFSDASRDYQNNSVRARRNLGGARTTSRVSLPMVLTPTEAYDIAKRRLHTAHVERDTFTFDLPFSYLWAIPGSTVLIDDGRMMRIDTRSVGVGVIRIGATNMWPRLAVPTMSVADVQPFIAPTLDVPTVGQLVLCDIPPLRDEDDSPGWYYGVGLTANRWPGVNIYTSDDNANFELDDVVSQSSTTGFSTSALPPAPTAIWDYASTVTVKLLAGTLESADEGDVLTGTNWGLLGQEIIAFQTATLTAANTYVLSGLLRGCRGTEAAVGTHTVGDAFLLFDSSTMGTLPLALSDVGQTEYFKTVSGGLGLSDLKSQTVVYTGARIRPLSPAQLDAYLDTGNLVVTWQRRARINAGWRDYADVPLDEPVEQYQVLLSSNGVALRTIDVPAPAGGWASVPTWTYPAAMITQDLGSKPDRVDIAVVQVSSRVGNGTPATLEFRFESLRTADTTRYTADSVEQTTDAE